MIRLSPSRFVKSWFYQPKHLTPKQPHLFWAALDWIIAMVIITFLYSAWTNWNH